MAIFKTNKPEINWDASPMASHIGYDEQGNQENPWDLGLVVVGAFREDEEDPVYGYAWPNETSTHFWNADGGDGWTFCPFPCCGCYPNAYKKAQIYINGGQNNPIFFQKPVVDPTYGYILGRYYSYDNLFAFYNTGHCYYWGHKDMNGHYVEEYNPPLEINIPLATSQKWAWCILGRTAHLLQDIGVPAHAHGDLAGIYSSIGNFSTQHPASDPVRHADYAFCFSIKATASLFYWFAQNTNQFPPPPPGPVTITSNLPLNVDGSWNLYKLMSGYFTGHSNNATSFQWEYYLCNNAVSQPWPLDQFGLRSGDYNNVQPMNINNNNYSGGTCPLSASGPFWLRVRVKAIGANNQSAYSNYYTVYPSSSLQPGGCPWLLVNSDSSSMFDNNILYRSEFPENVGNDIKDLYKLTILPRIDSLNEITLQIKETESDYNYFDQCKLYAIDHPVGTKIGITESNQIVMFYDATVQSTDVAILNSTSNITPLIQYNTQGKKIVNGNPNDSIFAHYDTTSQLRAWKFLKSKYKSKGKMGSGVQDSLALIGELGQNTDAIIISGNIKKDAGNVTIYTNTNTYVKQFARRERNSNVIIPFSALGDNSVDHIDVNFYRDYQVTYFSVVPVTFDGYTQIELPLVAADHSTTGDISPLLLNQDGYYAELDTTAIITLKFNASSQPNPGYLRDYILETNGRYDRSNAVRPMSRFSSTENNNSLITQYALFNNYPNPFNPVTSIKYSIARSGFVKIIIYDILGHIVSKLVNEYEDKGTHSVNFDGSRFASGVYFYKLETDNFVETKKMVLIK